MDDAQGPDPIDAEAIARATVNILEDSAAEREQLRDTQRAVLNMLEDIVFEQRRLEDTQRATLNILDDFERVGGELRRANSKLTHLDSLKSEFVAMASHELRTPLTSIAGFSSTILRLWETITEANKFRYVGVIDEQARRLTRLVEDLLTLSSIESGSLRVNGSEVFVETAVLQAIQDVGAQGVSVSCATNLAVNVDPDHLIQIMVNYLTNALKYGGHPTHVEVISHGADVQICVSDCGAGVPDEFVDRLFERFAQADPDQSRSSSNDDGRGTGLGLSIVRALAVAHGGDAWYEPGEPTGSCFFARLPAWVAPPSAEDGLTQQAGSPRTVSVSVSD